MIHEMFDEVAKDVMKNGSHIMTAFKRNVSLSADSKGGSSQPGFEDAAIRGTRSRKPVPIKS